MPAPRRPPAAPASIWDEAALAAALDAAGVKTGVHVQKIYSHLLRDPHAHPADAPGLPLTAAAIVRDRFVRRTSRLTTAVRSAGGGATKLLLRLHDGLEVEAVIMTYDSSKSSGRKGDDAGGGGIRHTLCFSSQAGCAMACTFCATGTMGHLGDLTAAEILEQMDWAAVVVADEARAAGAAAAPTRPSRSFPIKNVVAMGQGEPLNNYDAVVTAVRAMTDSARFGLRSGAVTISTVGVIPRVLALATDLPRVSFALSLHAPNQELRARIVPSARAYPLPRLMAAVDKYQAATKRRVFVEYVLLAGVNDAPDHARELAALLAGRDVVVNIIPWNPFPPADAKADCPAPPELFAAPGPDAVAAFFNVLRAAGLPATVRQEKGQDVAAACGQLALASAGVKTEGGGGCGPPAAARDMEDLVMPPPPATPAPARGLAARVKAAIWG